MNKKSRLTVLLAFVGLGLTLAIGVAALVEPAADETKSKATVAVAPNAEVVPPASPRAADTTAAPRSVESPREDRPVAAILESDDESPPPSETSAQAADPLLPVSTLISLLDRVNEAGRATSAVPAQQDATTVALRTDLRQPELEPIEPPARGLPPGAISPTEGEGDDQLTINLQDNDLREVLQLLSEQSGLNILAGKSVQGRVTCNLTGVDIQTALTAILRSAGLVSRREGQFVYVGTPQDFSDMERLEDRISVRVYRPNYVTALELQTLITPLTTQTGKVSVTSAGEAGIGPNSNSAGGDSYANGPAVVVQDYEAVLVYIDQVVAEIDVRPMQVAIEAMILSVKLDDTDEFGVNFQLLRDKEHVRLGSGSPLATLSSFALDGGFKFAFLDSSLGAFLTALETIGETNVIASPRLLCLNRQRAEILIGAQLGYVNTTVTETNSTQSVDFLEVGTQLRLRPYISQDGMIRMEVHPELSTGQVRVEDGLTLPDKELTQVTTNIMCRDGSTIVIGGLMREDLGTSRTQIPFLGNVPVVGFLFRTKEETTSRQELIVLITPRIMYDDESCAEGEEAAMEFHRRQAVYADHMSPLGKRFLARKHFRRSQEAWAAGDERQARRAANLAIYFDPTNRAAIDLRADIEAGIHGGPHSGGGELPAGWLDEPLDGDEVAPWLLDELEAPGSPPLHPYYPGVPGPTKTLTRPEALAP